MADIATPASPVDAKKEHVKPEKPDEEAYKASLKKAEKDHTESMAKFVSCIPLVYARSITVWSADCIGLLLTLFASAERHQGQIGCRPTQIERLPVREATC
jgi:hypothetical protein